MSATIHPTATVEDDAAVGAETSIWHHAHVRSGARVGARCNLGKNVYVDAGAVIGDDVKIQNNVSVYVGVTIGDRVFVGPSVTFTNDRYPRAFVDDFDVVATNVLEGASIGANATVVCGTTIGAYATVGAGSVVTHDVADHQLVVGNPARHRGWVCRCGRLASSAAERPDGDVECSRCGEVDG